LGGASNKRGTPKVKAMVTKAIKRVSPEAKLTFLKEYIMGKPKKRKLTRAEIARKGGLALVKKYGAEYMAQIGSRGFYAAIESISARNPVENLSNVNQFRHLLRNLKAGKEKKKDAPN
jgi:hypothetical protein